METSGTTYRWVAGRGDSRACTHALFSLALRRARLWVAVGLMAIGLALLSWSTGTNLPLAVAWAVGFVAVMVAAALGLLYVVSRRRFGRQLAPGLTLESEYGADDVVLRGPWTESRVQFAGIEQVRRSHEWVVLRQRRSRMLSCWPAALFPPAELARVEAALDKHS